MNTEISQRLACLDADLTKLLDVDLAGLADLELVEVVRRFEAFRNRLPLFDHRLVNALEVSGTAESLCVRSTAQLIAQTCRVSRGEARRRVLAAEMLTRRVSLTGEQVEVRYSHVADAQHDGLVNPDQVAVIITGLNKLDRLLRGRELTGGDLDQAAQLVAESEQLLTQHAATLDAGEIRRCVDRMLEHVDPDGVLGEDHGKDQLRELHLTHRPDGLYNLRGVLTGQTGTALQAVLRPLASRRSTCVAEGDVAGADERDYPQLMHDALDDLVHRMVKSDSLPTTGGTPATVLITVSAADLARNAGYATTSDGGLVPLKRLAEWAGEADLVSVYTSPTGEVLELGRSRRIASKHQTLALIARDGACSFPGCDHPPDWCDRHHIRSWQDHGPTNVSNLTLLCRYHHRRFEQHGWTCTMIDGLPHWTPPKWVDQQQKPILNDRIARRHRRDGHPEPDELTLAN